jgi:N-acetylglucosamine-6-phosphate deacetylase
MTALRGRVVTAEGVLEDAVVRVRDGKVADVSPVGAADSAPADETIDTAWIVPGFIDLHVHGGGGGAFDAGDPDTTRSIIDFHRRQGTTTMLASLVTASVADTRARVAALGSFVHSGELAGVHLEGPYLSTARCGAQNPAHLRNPDSTEIADLIGLDAVRTVTMAPELPGALPAIAQWRAHGVAVAIGHTDATYEQTLAAIDAGATLATHLGNAMRPIHHRDPGPIVALLASPNVTCEVVADGVHLHDGMLRHAIQAAGPYRVALVTDAMAAAGMSDGAYELGGQDVAVRDGVARLASSGAIAGSTLTMLEAVRHTVRSGVSIVDAVTMASLTPARALGIEGTVGAIAPGLRADLVLLDENLTVTSVLRAGKPVS